MESTIWGEGMKILKTIFFIIFASALLPLMLWWKITDWASDGWFTSTIDKIWEMEEK